MNRRPLLFLELNEVNFDFVRHYAQLGELPTFARLIDAHGIDETDSEREYDHLEPWIQWVTAHTGLDYADHGVFRLGDIVAHDIDQIWERLERAGLRVGAVSPMNAKLRVSNPAFFVPDPWTDTGVAADGIDRRMFAVVRRAVNDNAKGGGLSAGGLADLALGGLRNARVANYPAYGALLAGARRKSWNKAIFLDQLLADMFVRLVRREKPDFATLFLNAAAHIQHHYMFSSGAYQGKNRNPDWYVDAGADPLLDVYRRYDAICGQVLAVFPEARLMIATGLHQVPYEKDAFYWRIADHAAFLREIGLEDVRVEPRMSRDFLVTCTDDAAADAAQRRLEQVTAEDGTRLFDIDNRGRDLFVTLTFPRDVPADAGFMVGNRHIDGLRDRLAFVAIKNGEHDGTGYFLDTGRCGGGGERFPLRDIPDRVSDALGVKPVQAARDSVPTSRCSLRHA